jgi:hypothetical protein
MEPAKASDPAPRVVKVEDLTPAWARAKQMQDLGAREADTKRDEILAAGGKPGYADDYLVITGTSHVEGASTLHVVKNKKLERALRDENVLEKAYEKKISLSRVRALSKLHPKIKAALDAITTERTRFEQAAKKKK